MIECGTYLKEAVAGFFNQFRVIMKYCGIDNYGLKSTPLIEKPPFNAYRKNFSCCPRSSV